MKIYFYAHCGHRTGLDDVRRLLPLVLEFQNRYAQEHEVLFLVNDVRARAYAREEGIDRVATLDGVQDIANIVDQDDLLIFASRETNDVMLQEMAEYYPYFVRFDDTLSPRRYHDELVVSPVCEDQGIIKALVIDPRAFASHPKTTPSLLFIGDSDYEEKTPALPESLANVPLLCGHYFSLDLRRKIDAKFTTVLDEENYASTIYSAQKVITASIQSALEVYVSGGEVTFFTVTSTLSPLAQTIVSLADYTPRTIDNIDVSSPSIDLSGLQSLCDTKTIQKLSDIIQETYLSH